MANDKDKHPRVDPPTTTHPRVETAHPPEVDEAESLLDVKQLGLFSAIASLGCVFWVVGGMEMIERLAFYGVKAVATLYAKDPKSAGGLGVTMSSFGNILMVWAFVQSVLPIFTGGLSDRYGYKETIFVSTVIKIMGYLVMAFFPTYMGFFMGAILLATGTAVFKPGIQGTLVKSTTRQNSSMAWGIFYQTVNIGGFLGPLLAGFMRKMAWQNVFFSCAVIISLNFILLLTYKEVGKEERLERRRLVREGKIQESSLWKDSLRELGKKHVWLYLLIFSGFWFMFMSLFDVLPAHIDDWVNTSDIVHALFGTGGTDNAFVKFFIVMNEEGTRIMPEGMVNINAGLIMTTCFLFAWLSGKMRATTSMTVGTLFATAALFLSGYATWGWMSLFAISIFSVGEMLSSPKFSEYIGNFAPADKKGMYLGFSQLPIAIGWTVEGKVGPLLYDIFASRDQFSRDLLAERGMGMDQISQIPQGEAFQRLVEFTGQAPEQLTRILYESHDVAMVWNIMGLVGIVSAIGIWWYGKWVMRLARQRKGPAAAR